MNDQLPAAVESSASVRPSPADLRLRWIFAAAVLLWLGLYAWTPLSFLALGVNHFGIFFLDTYAILASNDAVSVGLDPYVPNPLDPFRRPHVYSHWWLHLRDLGLTRAETFPVGLGLVGAFVAAALGFLRPRTGREAIFYFLILASPPILLALDRANNDLVIFLLLAPVVPCLRHERRLVRLFPVFLIGVAAALKYYPAVALLVVLLAGVAAEVRVRAMVGALFLLAVGADAVRVHGSVGALVPRAEGLTTFGAVNLLDAVGFTGWAGWAASGIFAAAVGLVAWRWPAGGAWRLDGDDQAEKLSFMLGATLLTACFFAGSNYAYRWIFAVWMAPVLWRGPSDGAWPAGLRRLVLVTRGLLLLALWADPLAGAVLTRFFGRLNGSALTELADRFFLWEQPLTWLLFGCLLVFVVFAGRAALARLRNRD